MHRKRILIADDDPAIVKFVRANLKAEGCETLVAMDGAEAIQVIERELPDLIILDITMPKADGFEVCRWLREWSQTPIIMLSARGDEQDKVKCLDLGADDYISKPFGIAELIARVRAVFRRSQAPGAAPTQAAFASGDLEVSFASRQVTVAGKEVSLTPTEYQLLQELVLNAGKVLTHSHLLNRVWGPEYREEKQYLHVFMNHLRMKVENESSNPRYILTVPGVGYLFKAAR
ncbi:MAG: response regulator transcription factor [Chloroflexi bacterium]|nr:response regulator transcription factor [Chloroflexota bacterium]